ncbi:MAG TPA: flagellar motor protein MotB [Chitinophagaceae bacterium]
MKKYSFVAAAAVLLLSSCVSSKKMKQKEAEYDRLNSFYTQVQNDLKACRSEQESEARDRAAMEAEIASLNKQLALVQNTSNTMVNQLKDLSVISGAQAESIKKSLENINSKDIYIQGLQREMSRKDSLNMALVMNLKSALKDVNDEDIEIKVEKGVVFVSISDKLLFASGSWNVNPKAMEVLGKVALVLNSRPEIEFMVEGHTDNVPIKTGAIADNWDLSAKRATSVVRILQQQYNIDPRRMTAGARSEYAPLQPNETASGKAANRRTRIVILPQLDQFFKLLETPAGAAARP